MAKTKWWLLLSALLAAVSASAQPLTDRTDRVVRVIEPRKVWTDADLAQPQQRLQRTPEPEAVAGLKRRADYVPLGAGGPAVPQVAAPAPPPPSLPRWEEPPQLQQYAAQPLWPVYVVLDQRLGPRRPLFCPRPIRLPSAPAQPVRWGIH